MNFRTKYSSTTRRTGWQLTAGFLGICLLFSACRTSKTTTDDTQVEYNSSEYLMQATLWYQNAAEYRALAFQAFNVGREMMDHYLATVRYAKPPCIVLDIDETVLNNSPYAGFQLKYGQGYTSETWQEWTARADADTIPGAVSFLKYAASRDVEIFYISNRKVAELDATIENMKKFGFPNADKDHVLLREETSDKQPRRDIVEKDHAIMLMFGDALGDFESVFDSGSTDDRADAVTERRDLFGRYFIVLPNPGYGKWESAIFDYQRGLSPAQQDSVRRATIRSFK